MARPLATRGQARIEQQMEKELKRLAGEGGRSPEAEDAVQPRVSNNNINFWFTNEQMGSDQPRGSGNDRQFRNTLKDS